MPATDTVTELIRLGITRGRSPVRALAFALSFLGCLASALADEGRGYPFYLTNQPALTTRVQLEGGPGLRTIRRAYVDWGADKFAFVVPDGYRLEPSNSAFAVLVNSDLSCQIFFRVIDPIGTPSDELDCAAYRDLLLARFPGAKILEEVSRNVANRHGPAINLSWTTPGHVRRQGSFVFIPFDGQVLELSLVASPDRFGPAWPNFYSLLLTFRAADRNGKLELPMMSDKI